MLQTFTETGDDAIDMHPTELIGMKEIKFNYVNSLRYATPAQTTLGFGWMNLTLSTLLT